MNYIAYTGESEKNALQQDFILQSSQEEKIVIK